MSRPSEPDTGLCSNSAWIHWPDNEIQHELNLSNHSLLPSELACNHKASVSPYITTYVCQKSLGDKIVYCPSHSIMRSSSEPVATGFRIYMGISNRCWDLAWVKYQQLSSSFIITLQSWSEFINWYTRPSKVLDGYSNLFSFRAWSSLHSLILLSSTSSWAYRPGIEAQHEHNISNHFPSSESDLAQAEASPSTATLDYHGSLRGMKWYIIHSRAEGSDLLSL